MSWQDFYRDRSLLTCRAFRNLHTVDYLACSEKWIKAKAFKFWQILESFQVFLGLGNHGLHETEKVLLADKDDALDDMPL